MRQQAVVDNAGGLVPFGHVGWSYDEDDDFYLQAGRYIEDGLAHGQHVEYVGAGSRETLREQLARLESVTGRDLGRVVARPLGEFYDVPTGTTVIDPARAVDARVSATERAVADGHGGFRAVVDTTAMAMTPAQRASFVRFEYLIDQKMAVLPVSALCGSTGGSSGTRPQLECGVGTLRVSPGRLLVAHRSVLHEECHDHVVRGSQPARR